MKPYRELRCGAVPSAALAKLGFQQILLGRVLFPAGQRLDRVRVTISPGTAMASDPEQPGYDLQQEIVASRPFSLADLIGREGSGLMKGESPVPPLVQAKAEMNLFVCQHLADSDGALQAVLQSLINDDQQYVSQFIRSPLQALRAMVEPFMQQEQLLYDLVRRVDARWGQMYDERPHFQSPGQVAHPDDVYTHESVRATLQAFLAVLESTIALHP